MSENFKSSKAIVRLYLVPDVVVPNGVVCKVLHDVAVFVLDDVDGEAPPTVVRRVEPGHRPARDSQGSANYENHIITIIKILN